MTAPGFPQGWEWDALAAIGTVGAAVIALGIALSNTVASIWRRRVRRKIVRALMAPHVERIFDALESSANNPGVIADSWNNRVILMLGVVGRNLGAETRALETYLQDLRPADMQVIAALVSGARRVEHALAGFERHEPRVQLELADYLTKEVHADVTKLFALHSKVMLIIGVKEAKAPWLLERKPRAGEDQPTPIAGPA